VPERSSNTQPILHSVLNTHGEVNSRERKHPGQKKHQNIKLKKKQIYLNPPGPQAIIVNLTGNVFISEAKYFEVII
jgi:hypothetical protein